MIGSPVDRAQDSVGGLIDRWGEVERAVFGSVVANAGLSFYGIAVLRSALLDGPASTVRPLAEDFQRVIILPGRLAREVGAPRQLILLGLRDLMRTGVLKIRIVSGALGKRHCFEVRLPTMGELHELFTAQQAAKS